MRFGGFFESGRRIPRRLARPPLLGMTQRRPEAHGSSAGEVAGGGRARGATACLHGLADPRGTGSPGRSARARRTGGRLARAASARRRPARRSARGARGRRGRRSPRERLPAARPLALRAAAGRRRGALLRFPDGARAVLEREAGAERTPGPGDEAQVSPQAVYFRRGARARARLPRPGRLAAARRAARARRGEIDRALPAGGRGDRSSDRPPPRPEAARPGGRRARSLRGPRARSASSAPAAFTAAPRPAACATCASPTSPAARRSSWRAGGDPASRVRAAVVGAGRDGAVREAGRDGPGQAEHGLGPHARAGREHEPGGGGRGRAPVPGGGSPARDRGREPRPRRREGGRAVGHRRGGGGGRRRAGPPRRLGLRVDDARRLGPRDLGRAVRRLPGGPARQRARREAPLALPADLRAQEPHGPHRRQRGGGCTRRSTRRSWTWRRPSARR